MASPGEWVWSEAHQDHYRSSWDQYGKSLLILFQPDYDTCEKANSTRQPSVYLVETNNGCDKHTAQPALDSVQRNTSDTQST